MYFSLQSSGVTKNRNFSCQHTKVYIKQHSLPKKYETSILIIFKQLSQLKKLV